MTSLGTAQFRRFGTMLRRAVLSWTDTWSIADVLAPAPGRRMFRALSIALLVGLLLSVTQYVVSSARAGELHLLFDGRHHHINLYAVSLALLLSLVACRRQLVVSATTLLLPFATAVVLWAMFALLAPWWLAPGLVARWLVALAVVTLLAMPPWLRLWGMLSFALETVARARRTKALARAALAGDGRATLAARIEGTSHGQVDLTVFLRGRKERASLPKRSLPYRIVDDGYVGSWLLLQAPRWRDVDRLEAKSAEYVGEDPKLPPPSWVGGEIAVAVLALAAFAAAEVVAARWLTMLVYGW